MLGFSLLPIPLRTVSLAYPTISQAVPFLPMACYSLFITVVVSTVTSSRSFLGSSSFVHTLVP
ncbi:hypothetical protein BCR44DRAFT_1424240 [Catenaria anguillulae PL171]|uniref:Uncharacterized protein n=1 Tax=Catenaria anguillulae PL171 TaxID=765915 RepID=A0A1Y2I499_9FUNG|nr:hypothetical protein BCR44DRAFT_1424240 [Catenaria anguillulae PL171]